MNRVILTGVLCFKEHLQFLLFFSAFNLIIREIKRRNQSLRIAKKKVFKVIRTSQVWSYNLVHNFGRTRLEWAPMIPNCDTILALNLAITVTWSLKNMLWKFDVTSTRWDFQEIIRRISHHWIQFSSELWKLYVAYLLKYLIFSFQLETKHFCYLTIKILQS